MQNRQYIRIKVTQVPLEIFILRSYELSLIKIKIGEKCFL